VVNVWERSYRAFLESNALADIVAANRFPFRRTVVLVNNVEDREHADALARAKADEVHHVADHLDRALDETGLTRRDLGRVPQYSDCALVAVTLPGAPWVVYWDADVRLSAPADWITPSLARFEADPRVLVANPGPVWDAETLETDEDFALGHGFSDQLFLTRRSDLAQPIYRQRCAAQLRYPLAHVAAVFESRVDAWMRHNDRLRATYRHATYVHPEAGAGTSYPPQTARERCRALGVRVALAGLRATPRPLRKRCVRTVA
jgi:hypothetical protein